MCATVSHTYIQVSMSTSENEKTSSTDLGEITENTLGQ